ncbi:MAG: DNA-directed RNA polymerase subunit omega [Rhodobacterales bacterium 32-67-9]|nr:MAG: DNA-directed RNA polymerase subunit omega [Rhodobacterales bacterium 32-67-9]
MVFKRRNPRTYLQMLAEAFWPRGGWTRAFHYVKHRIRRLPDDPHRIARGVGAGVFISFTPLFGLHFLSAVAVAKLVRGNLLASLLGTFFGNPVSFPIIAFTSMKLGHLILGTNFDESQNATLFGKFVGAGEDLKHNFLAIFTDATTQWANLYNFWNEVFLPYLVGGLLPGIVAGVVSYYLSEPLIAAYQKHRRKRLRDRFEKLRARLHARQEQAREKG